MFFSVYVGHNEFFCRLDFLVEALTGKKGTFLLSTLQLEYYCDMIVWYISYRNLFGKPFWTNQ